MATTHTFGNRVFNVSTNKYSSKWKKNIAKYNGQIVAEKIDVSWCDIDIENRTNQCRLADTVSGHISELAINIYNNGLREPPTVEWDTKTNKFTALSGHHRLLAQKKLTAQADDNGKPKQLDSFIVNVVKFSSSVDRLEYLHAENQHSPAKAGTWNDAVLYLQDHSRLGSFNHLSGDQEGTYNFAKSMLTRMYGGRLTGFQYPKVIEAALGSAATRLRPCINYQGDEMETSAQEHWNDSSLASGKNSRGDVCYILQAYRAYRGVVFGAGLERAMQIGQSQATNPMSIKVMSHVRVNSNSKKPAISIDKTRKTMLEELKYCNTDLFKSSTSIVDEVVFLPQVKATEKTPIVYKWNKSQQKFI